MADPHRGRRSSAASGRSDQGTFGDPEHSVEYAHAPATGATGDRKHGGTGDPHPAVQPGAKIASVKAGTGGVPFAFIQYNAIAVEGEA